MTELDTASAYLFYDEQRRILICRVCKFAINPRRDLIVAHLTKAHSLPKPPSGAALVPPHVYQDAIFHDDKEGVERAMQFGYSAHLNVFSDGYCCTDEGHNYCCRKESTMIKHVHDKHTRVRGQSARDQFFHPVPVSTIFEGYTVYFRVRMPCGNGSSKAPAALGEAEDWVREYGKQKSIAQAEAPVQPADTDLSLWLRHTGWPAHFAGKSLLQIAELAQVRMPGDPDQYSTLLVPNVEAFVLELATKTSNFPSTARRIYRSLSSKEMSTKELRIVSNTSSRQYSYAWTRFLLFLLRTRHDPESAGLPSDENLTSLVSDLHTSLVERRGATEIRLSIRLLVEYVVCQRVSLDRWASPLYVFLAVDGFDLRTRAWKTPFEYRPVLSKIIYVIRLVAINMFFRRNPDPTDNLEDMLLKHASRRVYVGSTSIFDALHNLRMFAKGLAKNYYVHPSIVWEPGSEALIYLGQRISLPAVANMMAGLLNEAERLALELTFRSHEHLATRRPELFVDDFMWASNGHSFVNLDANKSLSNGFSRVLGWAASSPTGQYLFKSDGAKGFDTTGVQLYLNTVERLLEILAVLAHVTGGLPARGTELCALKHCNSIHSQRSVYLFRDHVILIAEYNKTQNLSEDPNIITRALPPALSRLLVTYLADILPFAEGIWGIAVRKDSNHVFPEQLFQTAGRLWNPQKISTLLGDAFFKATGSRITIAKWRDISIAIEQEHLREAVDNKHSLQFLSNTLAAGHSRETEEHHYAIRLGFLAGLHSRDLKNMVALSRKWHVLFQLDENGYSPLDENYSEWIKLRHREIRALDGRGGDTNPASRDQKRGSSASDRGAGATQQGEVVVVPPCPSPASVDLAQHLRAVYGPSAEFRQGQELALRTVLAPRHDCLAVLPTGCGKSALVTIPAILQKGACSVLVVPFIALRDDLRARCAAAGLQAVVWTPESPAVGEIVMVTPEIAAGATFDAWISARVVNKSLARVYVDEAHVFVTDAKWRGSLGEINWLTRILRSPHPRQGAGGGYRPKIVFMTGTLPAFMEQQLCQTLGVRRDQLDVVRETCTRTNISYRFAELESAQQQQLCVRLVKAQVEAGRKTVLFVRSKADGDVLCERLAGLKPLLYHGKMDDDAKAKVLEDFRDGRALTVVATTAFGTGIHVPGLYLAVFYGGVWSLIDFIQQAGRLARDLAMGFAVCLMSRLDRERVVERARTDHDAFAFAALINSPTCRLGTLNYFLDGAVGLRCSAPAVCDLCARDDKQAALDDVSLALNESPGSKSPNYDVDEWPHARKRVKRSHVSNSTLPDSSLGRASSPGTSQMAVTLPPSSPPGALPRRFPGRSFSPPPPQANASPTVFASDEPQGTVEWGLSELLPSPRQQSLAAAASPPYPNSTPSHISATPLAPTSPYPASGIGAPSSAPREASEPDRSGKSWPSALAKKKALDHSSLLRNLLRRLDVETSCMYCGMLRRPGWRTHVVHSCSYGFEEIRVHCSGLMGALRKAGVTDANKGVCYNCMLPMHAHPNGFKNKRSCRLDDLLAHVLITASELPEPAAIMEKMGLTPPLNNAVVHATVTLLSRYDDGLGAFVYVDLLLVLLQWLLDRS